MKRTSFAAAAALLLGFLLTTNADILFQDDFEAEGIGDDPQNWEPIDNFPVTVEEDPLDASNQVLRQEGEWEDFLMPVPKDTMDAGWTDYIWEYDWYYEGDDYYGTAHRIQDATTYYHFSRRLGGSVSLFSRQGGYTERINVAWPEPSSTWYSIQISLIGSVQEVRVKEQDDDTPFEEIAPILELDDDLFDEGTIGLFGGGTPLYWDNIIIYEPGTNIRPVDPKQKMADTWGRLKAPR